MKKLLLITLTSLFFISCKGQETDHFKILDSAQYEQIITQNEVVIIDVRTPAEYQNGHLENAQNINVQSRDFSVRMENFDKERPVYIYCRSGSRSIKAGKILDRKSTRLNSSHVRISYAVFC